MAMYICNCGDKFTNRRELVQHIGLLNPRWPRKDPSDEHWEISKAEYLNRQYRILNPKEEK
jgi:hypothetical protein